MEDFNTDFLELSAVGLAAGADEIVEAVQFMTGAGGRERARKGAAHEAADAGDQNTHKGKLR